jgi:hypothetical protein
MYSYYSTVLVHERIDILAGPSILIGCRVASRVTFAPKHINLPIDFCTEGSVPGTVV